MALSAGLQLLRPGGRIVVLTYHSLEDRIVKRFIATERRGCVCPPVLPVCVCGRTPRLRIVPGHARLAVIAGDRRESARAERATPRRRAPCGMSAPKRTETLGEVAR